MASPCGADSSESVRRLEVEELHYAEPPRLVLVPSTHDVEDDVVDQDTRRAPGARVSMRPPDARAAAPESARMRSKYSRM